MTFATPRDRFLPPKDMIGVLFFACVMSGLLATGLQVALHVLLESNLALYHALRTLAVVTLVTTAVLAVAWQRARTVSGIDRTALAIIVFVAAGRMWPLIMSGPTREALAILAETLLPMAVMIWFQWGLLRRNWRHRKGS